MRYTSVSYFDLILIRYQIYILQFSARLVEMGAENEAMPKLKPLGLFRRLKKIRDPRKDLEKISFGDTSKYWVRKTHF